ncbi:MAG TPA: DUF4214 domain-containing protein [Pyrinomonadaceae bacterium]|nr:DUF4214 domain-containing protein [Pyrinomonadaceae bacterium]
MRKILVAFTLVTVLAVGAFAQTEPTLRIVTEDPTLPSELFYGNIKVKPLRLRPGTNVRITIDDSDFFVQQHYIDFLSRFPELEGFNSWLNFLNSEQQRCPTDPECLHQARLTASASFFGSQEFNLKGGYVFRFYKASLARMPEYPEMVAGMRSVTGATADEVNQKRAEFAANWVVRPDFLNEFPRGMDAAAFVGKLEQIAGVTLANRQSIIAALANNNSDAGRAVAMGAIADSQEVQTKEFNPSFVYMQYVGYLRRAPEAAGYNAWLTYLNANPTQFREMVRGFVDSIEYRNRF